MFKKIFTLVASAVMCLTAGQAWAQVNNISVAEFDRITDVSQIVSGDKYLITNPGASGIVYILDGSVQNKNVQPSSEVSANNGKIQTELDHSFVFTKIDDGTNRYSINSYKFQNRYLNLGSESINYGTISYLHVESVEDSGFKIYRLKDENPNNYKYSIRFNEGTFSGLQENKANQFVDLYKLAGYLAYSTNRCEVVYEDRESAVLPALDAYNFNYVFSSSNPSVASVVEDGDNKGKVTISGVGNTIITVKGYWRPYITASYELMVRHRGVISWNPQKQFEVGNDVTNRLNISTNGNGQVTFTSSDPNVLAVSEDGHTVTAVGLGTATLQAMVSSTDQYTAATSTAVSISVVPSSPNLTFAANSSTTIYVDDELQTSVSHLGNGRITYSSSNESVAKIDDEGKVQGLNAGTATITATISAAGYYKAESKTISVTVRKYTVGMTGLLSSATMAVGDVQTLSVTSESTGKKVYRSSNDKVATVSDKGIITAVGPGTAAIYYKIDENYKYGAIAEKSVSVSVKHNMSAKVNPSAIVLSVGAKKNFEIQVPQGYTGSYTVTMLQQGIATVSGTGTTREVTGVAPGSATIHIEFPATATYYGGSIDIPVTVLGIYQYQLTVVNAPSHGVSISICGVNYNEPTVFNSSHESITVSDVVVKAVPGFTSTVTVTGKEIKVTYSLIIPQKGTFVRIKNYYYNKYASMPAADNAVLTMDEANMGNIFYYDNDGHLLFYQNGQYVSYTNQMSKVKDAADASVFDFVNSSTNALYKECFKVKVKNGTSYLHGGATATTQGNGNAAEAYWYVETLNELPVALSANGLGYGSLYCPVPLEVPGGVTAYYISNRNNTGPGSSNVEHTLTLSPIASNIPANTPVILVGVPGMTYSFTLKYGASVSPISSMLIGHCAAQVTSVLANGGTVFALQPNEGQHRVDFYKYTQANTTGFKAYFVESVSTGAAYYRLVFEDEEATDMLQLEAIEAQETIYDLCGRSMGNNVESLPRGIYVSAGRKFVVK